MLKKIFRSFLCCIILVTLTNCENENDDSSLLSEELVPTNFSLISFNTFKENIEQNPIYANLENNFDFNYKNIPISSAKMGKWGSAKIDTDYIVLHQDKSIDTYTFGLELPDDSTIYNLLVITDKEKNVQNSRILAYTPSSEWLTDVSKPFSGFVRLEASNVFDFSNINDLTNRGEEECIESIEIIYRCDAGNNHAPNTCMAGGSEFEGVKIQYGPCPAEDSDDDGSPFEGERAGGGSGTPINTNGDRRPNTPSDGGDERGGGGGGGTVPVIPVPDEINFEDNITTQLGRKGSRIYRELLRQVETSPILFNFLIAFSPDQYDEQTITLRQEAVLRNPVDNSVYPEGVKAYTYPFPNTPFYEIVLRNSAIEEGSDVEVATYLIHEFLHATLLNHEKIGPASFREIFEEYIQGEFGIQLQHAIFADKYLWPMAQTLREFDNNREDIGFYYIMAHIGIPNDLADPNVTHEILVERVLYFRNRQ